MKTYTIIVGRPDYVSVDPISDTYMTSLGAENAAQAGQLACVEAAKKDNGDDEDDQYDPYDYVVVAVLLGEHNDYNGRTDV